MNNSEEPTGGNTILGKDAADLTLCYLHCPMDAAGGFLGAILLTDSRARPEHFAFVQAIKPTKMQRLLYGSTLDEYIKIDVIVQKLWQGLPKKADILMVDAADLIAARRITQIPTCFLSQRPDSESTLSSISLLKYSVNDHTDDHGVVGEVVGALEGTCNLLEPFKRISEALKEGLKVGS